MIHEAYRAAFAGKKITVMGLGLLGRGIGDVQFLAECGAELIVTDLKTEEQLAESVAKLAGFKNIELRLGEHRLEDFEGRDMILKAAGVPLDSPFILHAEDKGIRVAMSAELFAELSGIPIIAVTGTRGKSTTAYLIHHVLQEATEGGVVLLGGNVRGVSNLQLLKEVQEDAVMVMELDSWQLQGFGESKRSPNIAVFTTFLDDHLNYYKDDRASYFHDKANIFRYQHASDTFVTTPDVLKLAQAHAKEHGYQLDQDVVLADASTLPDDVMVPLLGEHNRMNAALAYEALRAVGLEHEEIAAHIASFKGVPGRLERLGVTKENVLIYNDNNATTPDATIAALRALGDESRRDIVLILGGADKKLDTKELFATIEKFVKVAVWLPGTGTDAHADYRAAASEVRHLTVQSLDEAVDVALREASSGDIMVLSPAFASFGLFVNEYDRNDQFVALVGKHLSA
ncbi:UDP-N-acetylmuramoylalanine--D-glutamate ligase [Candidatus Kaiserbacteria bacterium RIFCSPHIGHO2_02_FULL_50_50]|uniref:UDP-N-acetylmuramoylalanine--D-glutamate ligase n=1 Tax=Candidatus Kaiserbacteria bacterium RIFCSPHIGHO2_02_FULL_50_50 TaxID=1798492 RepID=A0A1F6DGG6_9BACT|nr:MAG: UDP-N-acetylmuramoylalanine--D-glutamate ligase [Candidatus Kaiserbacteria bacterium RIFCSPHIGHO2_02_FULL_50_50]OGG88397.1 MAG: UDP-N-acetylmuramoylalanine--D-glutamate ligase [Candidatus Kaiserbacteria bacterium RIFCSPLOWO2_12_FULL_50_10]